MQIKKLVVEMTKISFFPHVGIYLPPKPFVQAFMIMDEETQSQPTSAAVGIQPLKCICP